MSQRGVPPRAALLRNAPSPLAGEGSMVRTRIQMGEGSCFAKDISCEAAPSPIIGRGSTELPSPARGYGMHTFVIRACLRRAGCSDSIWAADSGGPPMNTMRDFGSFGDERLK